MGPFVPASLLNENGDFATLDHWHGGC